MKQVAGNIKHIEATMHTRTLFILSLLLGALCCSAQTSPSSSSAPREIPAFDINALLLQPENVVLTATRLCHPLSIK
jgi:hypothetical protein